MTDDANNGPRGLDPGAFVKETRRPDCHPDYRFRAVLATGESKHFPSREQAVAAVVASAEKATHVRTSGVTEAMAKYSGSFKDRGVIGVYRNHRGEVGQRLIVPASLWFGSNQFHSLNSWHVDAVDVQKGEVRSFVVGSFLEWKDIGQQEGAERY
jgi:hypothetical protein